MAEKPSWIVLTSSQRSELTLVWNPGVETIPASGVPSVFPKRLRLTPARYRALRADRAAPRGVGNRDRPDRGEAR